MRPLPASALLLAFLATGAASAQPSGADTAVDVAVAKSLLERARGLARQGDCRAAIAAYGESLRHERSPAALFGLAECHEQLGAIVTAWGWFHQAEERAQTLGDAARAKLAEKRQAALEPRFPRLRVKVTADAPRAEICVDGREMSASALETAIPLSLQGTF